MEKKCKQIGVIDNGGYEKVNRVYRGGVVLPLPQEITKMLLRW